MIINIILTIILFMILVIPHEFGHLVAAKKMGVKVNEFSAGMGPALWQKQKGETLYSVRAVPLGGYCAMEGEDATDDEANVPDNPRAFNNAAWWRKLVILFAGAFTNILVAIVTMIITVTIIGMPVNTLSKVSPDGPAAQAGLRQGDKIVSVQGEDVHSWSDTMSVLNREDGKRPIKVEVLRSGKTREYSVTPVASEKEPGRYVIGIEAAVSHNIFTGIYYGTVTTWKVNAAMYQALGQMFSRGVSAGDVAGPVGLVSIVDKTRAAGLINLLYLVSIISLNLAIINLLPIPALDGGRILFVIIRKISGDRITDKMESYVHLAGMMLLLILFVFITWHDITGLIK